MSSVPLTFILRRALNINLPKRHLGQQLNQLVEAHQFPVIA